MANRANVLTLLVAVCLSSPAVGKQGQIMVAMNDRPYLEVRSHLISIGFRPLRTKNRDTPDENCPGLSSCSAYPEIVYCSGTGLAFCESAFFNRTSKRYIKVISSGEQGKLVDGIYYATNLDIRDWRHGTR